MANIWCQLLVQKGSNLVLLLLGLFSAVYWSITLSDWEGSNSDEALPGFNVTVMVLGFFIAAIAAMAIFCPFCLFFNLTLTVILILAQIAVVVVCAIDVKIQVYFPKDASGKLGEFDEFVKKNLTARKVIILVFEIIGICCVCCCSGCDGDSGGDTVGDTISPNLQANWDNHANQLNPNNWRFKPKRRH